LNFIIVVGRVGEFVCLQCCDGINGETGEKRDNPREDTLFDHTYVGFKLSKTIAVANIGSNGWICER
jgi:hypothetical protein